MLAAVAASEGAEPAQRVRAIFTPEPANPAAGPVAGDADPQAGPDPSVPPAAKPPATQ
jgi:hypothetical protein